MYHVSNIVKSCARDDLCGHEILWFMGLSLCTLQPGENLFITHLFCLTAWTAFSEPVTVKADPKSTFATNPVDVEESCFTYVTHLPYTTHCSLPCHFLVWLHHHHGLLLGHHELAELVPNVGQDVL